jgi:hypothetical protein
MSSNTTTFIVSLNNISIELNRYFGLFVFIFGSVGNILNILVLSQRPLRSNACALLFLVSSIFNLIAIFSGLTSRILSGWNIDPTKNIQWLCKLRIFIVLVSRTAAFWLIMLAAMDRWLLSSIHVHRRQMSSIKNAQRGIIIIIVLSIILFIQAPMCYEINSSNFPLQCYSKAQQCGMLLALTYGFITICLPIIMMNVLSMKTIVNIRQLKQDIHPLDLHISRRLVVGVIVPNRKWKKTDKRLLMMLFVQIIFFTFFTFPVVIYRLYSTVTMNNPKSELQNAVEDFIYNCILLISYSASGIPFYVYTLTGGKTFRNAFVKVMQCQY